LVVRFFAVSLPFLEAGVGLLLIIGLWTRGALVAGGLLMAALVFGTATQAGPVALVRQARGMFAGPSRSGGPNVAWLTY
jgi:uncharacterized membrane protein YphA (DoxX/SURF4 family)